MKTAIKASDATASRFILDSHGPRTPDENRRFRLDDMPLEQLSDSTTLGEFRQIVAQKFPITTLADLQRAVGFLTARLEGMDVSAVLAAKRSVAMQVSLQAQPASILLIRELVATAFPEADVK